MPFQFRREIYSRHGWISAWLAHHFEIRGQGMWQQPRSIWPTFRWQPAEMSYLVTLARPGLATERGENCWCKIHAWCFSTPVGHEYGESRSRLFFAHLTHLTLCFSIFKKNSDISGIEHPIMAVEHYGFPRLIKPLLENISKITVWFHCLL